ncbi:MAG: fumarate reductase/succinate dehydrogenase [Microbacterium sp.]|jgi:hypothetical protein|nr:fumarate reductase/succinate dehydrogenase [Microbacterium sp.]
MSALHTEVLVVGGGMGGVAAALAAARQGRRVVLTEEYEWLGGQLTSQAVPPDEHTWIEQFGATASYRELRDGIRDHYRRWYPLTAAARKEVALNPGAGLVSRLCAEPRAGVAVIDGLLAPHVSSGRLRILRGVRPTAASRQGDRIDAVEVTAPDGTRTRITADYVLDATELGDLLALAEVEHVTGFESRAQTGEPSAPEEAQPENQQAFSWCFVIDHVEGDHTIEKPDDYDEWRERQPEFWGAPMISLTGPHPRTLEIFTRTFTPTIDGDPLAMLADQRAGGGDEELWTFRRILAKGLFEPGAFDSDIVLVNWPMIDYLDGTLTGPDPEAHREAAKRQSLAMFYWLQTEAPRPDGGRGWPGLRLRGDITGTADGFAQAPYIRESRRIVAEYTVVEQDLSIELRGHARPAQFPDTVGIGMYRIDLHPTTGGDNYLDVASVPYEIPLGAMIPVRVDNLLPAGKNLGTTHITNGAFRLHPVEWNVGEVAGTLAAFCLERSVSPREVRAQSDLLTTFQNRLTQQGVELHWPDVTGY